MDIYRRMPICVVVAIFAVAGCGDEKGYKSLEDFYGGRPASSGSSGNTENEGGTGGTSAGVTCSISTSGLLVYLPFEGDARVRGSSSFQTSSDSSLRFISGQTGRALHGGDQVFLQATSSLSLSSWTACAWVRVGSSSNMGFVAAAAASPFNSGIGEPGETAECGGGSLAPYLSNESVGCLAPSSSSMSPGTFTFLCMVSDSVNGQTRIYVDGSMVANTSSVLPLSLSSGRSIAIGGGPDQTPNGTPNAIDEFSFWGRALSASELETLSESPCRATTATSNSEDSE